jgi:hypothetical protein
MNINKLINEYSKNPTLSNLLFSIELSELGINDSENIEQEIEKEINNPELRYLQKLKDGKIIYKANRKIKPYNK